MAVKANTKLTLQEMEQLLLDLSQAKNFLTCPHGRPIIYKITNREILKAFHRL
jgi:DNA mismatch repair protein MutL